MPSTRDVEQLQRAMQSNPQLREIIRQAEQPQDLTTRIIDSAMNHWLLVAGIVVVGYWVFPRVLKQTLLNGGGDTIRSIVRSENEAQTVKYEEKTRAIVTEALRHHEQVESADRRKDLAELEQKMVERYDLRSRGRTRK